MKILFSKIKDTIRPVLQRAASVAGQHTEKLSPERKRSAVIIFFILFSSLSFFIAAKTLSGTGKKIFFIRPISVPSHLHSDLNLPKPFISPEAYQKIERFKKYLDSISTSDKETFIRIMSERPHLTDSLAMFEKLYLSQSKK